MALYFVGSQMVLALLLVHSKAVLTYNTSVCYHVYIFTEKNGDSGGVL